MVSHYNRHFSVRYNLIRIAELANDDGSTDKALASESRGLSLVEVQIPGGAIIWLVNIDGQNDWQVENSVRNRKISQ